jgi:nitrite reductase/ring-hydroxylating ferredoxin subunit
MSEHERADRLSRRLQVHATGAVGRRDLEDHACHSFAGYSRVSMTSNLRDAQLVSLSDLDERQVTVVEHPELGALAVGMSGGQPFAVSNRCRHLLGPLGEGRVDPDGCLECPWHHARYDVRSGRMVAGPGGVFRPVGRLFKDTAGRLPLATYPVELRDGAIWLSSSSRG